jgi:hypothetical protein
MRRRHSIAGGYLTSIVAVLVALRIIHLNLAASAVQAQTPHSPPVPFVQGPNGPDFTALNDGAGLIKSRKWAVALGKALFWDQQAGSDGNACASCHCGAAGTNTTGLIVPLGLSDCDAPIGSAPRQACDTKADFIQVYGVEARHWMPAYAGMTGKRSFPRKRESREPYTPLQTALGARTLQTTTWPRSSNS